METKPAPPNPNGSLRINFERPVPPPPPGRRRRILWLYIPLLTVFLSAVTGVLVGASIQRPEVDSLDDFVPRLVTTLYDQRGQPIRTYQRENRIMLAENDIPEQLQSAILAAEDSNFFLHGGIDLKGILRAAFKNLAEGRKKEGASTITMQLARELFLSRAKKWTRKIEEAFLAVELEKKYSKQQILALYCNLVNLSQGNYGMEAAARNYFAKSVKDLTVAEAATLAGIPQRPSHYNVYERPDAVQKRRDVVLGRMLEERFIDRATYEQALAEPLRVVPRQRGNLLGEYFSEEVRRFLATTYGTTALYDRGLQVHTTLDRNIQRAAELALRDGLATLDDLKRWRGPKDHLGGVDLASRRLPSWLDEPLVVGEWYEGIVLESSGEKAQIKIHDQVLTLLPAGIRWTRKDRPSMVLAPGDVAWFRLQEPKKAGEEPLLVLEQEPVLEGAVVVLETATGAVRAMVGGWNFGRNEFNRATQARRQVGSTFKPFVFGAAFENGYTPADTIFDAPVSFIGADGLSSYSPHNYYERYYGIITLRQALEDSINVASVKLLDLIGVERVIDFARRCGVVSELPPYPSLALGVAGIAPLELAAAYATFANQGIYLEPHLIDKITTREGRVLEQHLPRAHQAMQPEVAYVMLHVLTGVVHSGTAASGLQGLELEMAGKTGTTDAYTDAWFVGFTPRYTILSWVGYDSNKPIGQGMTGAIAALPIWRGVVERGLKDGWLRSNETFPAPPPRIVEVEVEVGTGLRAAPGAARTLREAFIVGTEPEQKFDPSWIRILDLPWYLQQPFYRPKQGEKMP